MRARYKDCCQKSTNGVSIVTPLHFQWYGVGHSVRTRVRSAKFDLWNNVCSHLSNSGEVHCPARTCHAVRHAIRPAGHSTGKHMHGHENSTIAISRADISATAQCLCLSIDSSRTLNTGPSDE